MLPGTSGILEAGIPGIVFKYALIFLRMGPDVVIFLQKVLCLQA